MIQTAGSGNLLFLPLEGNLSDIGPNSYILNSNNEHYINTYPQSVGGVYAIGPSPSGYPSLTSDISNKLSSQTKYLITFDLFITGLEPDPTNSVYEGIFELKNGISSNLDISLRGHHPVFRNSSIRVANVGGGWATHTDLPANYTGVYTRFGILVSGANRSVYINNVLTFYPGGNHANPIGVFDRFILGRSNTAQFIKNFAIYTGVDTYTYNTYSGFLVISGTQNLNNYSVSIARTGVVAINENIVAGQNLNIDISNYDLLDRAEFDKVLLKKNNWVAAEYNINGITEGTINIL